VVGLSEKWARMTAHHGRTEGTSDTCEYGEGRCRKPAAGELRAHRMAARNHIPWAMCAGHLKPEAHPPDLRKALVRW
jgi:hypothetical protein